jgi:hypothetical protein
VVLDELLLGRLLRRDRRDRLHPVVVGVARSVRNRDRVVAVEAEAGRFLVEAHPVLFEVEQQRLVEAAALEWRRGRRHLQPRECLALEPQAHDFDRAQGLDPAVCLDCTIEHDARPRLGELGPGLNIGGVCDAGGGHGEGDCGAQHGGSPSELHRR